MSNQLLTQIHDHITRQIESALCERDQALERGDKGRAMFLKGRADELKSVRKFLSRHFDLATQKYY